MSVESEHWGIVGGGILGLTLALRLSQRGQKVTVYERTEDWGGLASAWSLGGVVWDKHYHVILLSDSYTCRLLSELGLERDIRWVEAKTGFYTDGELYSMSNTYEFLTFPPLGIFDKLRLGATIFYASRIKNWKRLESITVSEWLMRWSGKRTFEKIWLPLLRAKLGDNYRDTSAAFIWATIARLYAARRSGLKKEMFGYVTGGYARIITRLTEALRERGVRLKAGCGVSRIGRIAGGKVQLYLEGGEVDECTRAVLTVPGAVAAGMCPQLNADELARLKAIRYQGIVCASVLLKKSLADYYVTNITADWPPFTAVIEMSALVDRQHFKGLSLVYLPKYVVQDAEEFGLSDESIRERFLSALTRMYPHISRDDVVDFRVSRVRHVFPLPGVGYSKRLPDMLTSLPGVYVVNSAHILNGTLNVNETVKLAEDSLGRLLPKIENVAPTGVREEGIDETDCELIA